MKLAIVTYLDGRKEVGVQEFVVGSEETLTQILDRVNTNTRQYKITRDIKQITVVDKNRQILVEWERGEML